MADVFISAETNLPEVIGQATRAVQNLQTVLRQPKEQADFGKIAGLDKTRAEADALAARLQNLQQVLDRARTSSKGTQLSGAALQASLRKVAREHRAELESIYSDVTNRLAPRALKFGQPNEKNQGGFFEARQELARLLQLQGEYTDRVREGTAETKRRAAERRTAAREELQLARAELQQVAAARERDFLRGGGKVVRGFAKDPESGELLQRLPGSRAGLVPLRGDTPFAQARREQARQALNAFDDAQAARDDRQAQVEARRRAAEEARRRQEEARAQRAAAAEQVRTQRRLRDSQERDNARRLDADPATVRAGRFSALGDERFARTERGRQRRLTDEVEVAEANRALASATKRLAQVREAQAVEERLRREGATFFGRGGNRAQLGDDFYRRLGGGGFAQVEDRAQIETLRQQAQAEMDRRARSANVAARRQRSSGLLGGFVTGLSSGGLGGQGDDDSFTLGGIGRAAGNTLKYSLLYDAVSRLQQAFGAALGESVDFRDSLTDLNVALGDGGNASDEFVNNLSAFSRLSGSNVGEALDTAARGIRAFRATADDATKQDFGEQFTKQASQLALITNKNLGDASGDIIATANAFDLQANAVARVNDAVANAKGLGGDPKQISQGLANFADVASEAGLSLQEAASVISLVQARTDQSGQAVATRLSRVFAIVGGGAGQNALKDVGVNVNQSVFDQIQDLARLYPQLTSAQQAQIRGALGGTANLRELLPLLNNQVELQQNLSTALTNTGAGQDEFNRKSEDLAGLLRKIAGDVKNITVSLYQSGLFAAFGVALKTLEPLLNGLNELLQLYNRIGNLAGGIIPGVSPGTLKGVVALTAQFFLLRRAIAAIRASQGLAGVAAGTGATALGARGVIGAAGFAPIGAAGRARAVVRDQLNRTSAASLGTAQTTRFFRQNISLPVERFNRSLLRGDTSLRTFTRALAGSALTPLNRSYTRGQALSGVRGGFGAGFRGAGQLLSSEIGPLGAAVGGIGSIYAVLDAQKRFAAALGRARDTSAGIDVGGASADDLAEAAANLRTAAEDLRSSSAGFFGTITNLLTGNTTGRAASLAEERAGVLQTASERRAELEKRLSRQAQPDIDVSSVDGLTDGLNALKSAGRSGETQMRALIDSLNAAGNAAQGFSGRIGGAKRPRFSATAGDTVVDRLFQQREDLQETNPGFLGRASGALGALPFLPFGKGQSRVGTQRQQRFAREQLDALERIDIENLAPLIEEKTNAFLTATGGVFGADERKELTSLIEQELRRQVGAETYDADPRLRQTLRNVAVQSVAQTAQKVLTVTDPGATLAEAVQQAQGIGGVGAGAATRAGLSGRGSAETAGVRAQLGFQQKLKNVVLRDPNATAEQKNAILEQFQIELDETRLKLQQSLIADAQVLTDLAKSRLADTDTQGRLALDLAQVNTALARNTDGNEEKRLLAQRNDIRRAQARGQVDLGQARRRAGATPGDVISDARNALQDTEDNLRFLAAQGDSESVAVAEAVRARSEAYQEFIRAQDAFADAQLRAAVTPGDTVGEARVARQSADRQVNQLRRFGLENTPDFLDAQREAVRAAQEEDRAIGSRGIARLRAGTTPGDAVATSRVALGAANDEVARLTRFGLRDTEQYFDAITARKEAYADAVRAVDARADALLRASVDSRDSVGSARVAVQIAQRQVNQLQRLGLGGTAEAAEAAAALKAAQIEGLQQQIELANSARLAGVDPEAQVARASAELANARATLSGLLPGTREYYDQLAAIHSAAVELARGHVERASVVRQLGIDLTDPLATAREDVTKARDDLNASLRRGAPQEVTDQKRLAVRQAQNAEEAAAFDQRLDQVQTNERLGRTSHAAYLSYLRNEKTRLESIANRTYQQQKQLDQVDGLLQDASKALEGQFNLGDIKLPSPYEVRRFIAAQAGGLSASGQTNTYVTTNISINGADTEQVRRVLRDQLGPEAVRRNGVAQRRVL